MGLSVDSLRGTLSGLSLDHGQGKNHRGNSVTHPQ
jgi:hypothetical protein